MATTAKQLTQSLNGETTLELAYPVRLATGQVLDKVTVRRPRVGDLRAVAHIASEAEQGLALVSQITGLVPEDLDMLDLKDLERIQATFRAEDEGQPETAQTASEPADSEPPATQPETATEPTEKPKRGKGDKAE